MSRDQCENMQGMTHILRTPLTRRFVLGLSAVHRPGGIASSSRCRGIATDDQAVLRPRTNIHLWVGTSSRRARTRALPDLHPATSVNLRILNSDFGLKLVQQKRLLSRSKQDGKRNIKYRYSGRRFSFGLSVVGMAMEDHRSPKMINRRFQMA
jgi:hypothetical protein